MSGQQRPRRLHRQRLEGSQLGAPLAITPGDPRGIGPEVAALWLGRVDRPPAVVYGDRAALIHAAHLRGVSLDGVAVIDPGDDDEPVEVAALRRAVADVRGGACCALVTGPIHKGRLMARGFPHPGHTDFLGELCGVERPVMAFVGGAVRVALVTVHLPLRRVADAVNTDGVLHTIRAAHDALVHQLGLSAPRLAVCGLNPHAGDDGALGHEDATVIAPAVAQARALGIDARGPISAEAAFRQAVAGANDLVVAMYHDQGLAPLKALCFGESVNWTLGLPIVRTSVDHGTADDIAGQGVADGASFTAAADLAWSLVGARAADR